VSRISTSRLLTRIVPFGTDFDVPGSVCGWLPLAGRLSKPRAVYVRT
jgi:hypothetical protein